MLLRPLQLAILSSCTAAIAGGDAPAGVLNVALANHAPRDVVLTQLRVSAAVDGHAGALGPSGGDAFFHTRSSPWLLTDDELPMRLPPDATYALGVCAWPGTPLCVSADWYALDEVSEVDTPPPPRMPVGEDGRDVGGVHTAHFWLTAPPRPDDAPPYAVSIIPVERSVRLGVPFAAICRVTASEAADAAPESGSSLELLFPGVEPPPTKADAWRSTGGSSSGGAGGAAVTAGQGGGSGGGANASGSTSGGGGGGGPALGPALACLLERVVVDGLQPGTSASVRIECIAMRPGAPVFETWRLGIKATEQGAAPSRAKMFWVAATVEVEVE